VTPSRSLGLPWRHKKAAVLWTAMKAPPDVMPCRVGLRDYLIETNGDVWSCIMGFSDPQQRRDPIGAGNLGPPAGV
jgi:hypothetical protein